MSRGEGFEHMDLATSICDDPKFKRLARLHPEHLPCAFMVYVATLAASWREGARVTVDDAWPALLPYEPASARALQEVGLVDSRLRVGARAWDQWFGPAQQRREVSRSRWQRANALRRAVTAQSPRGDDDDTDATRAVAVPSRPVPSNGESIAREDIEAYLTARGRLPTEKQQRILDDVLARHDVTGAPWAAAIILAHPDDPIGAVISADKTWRAERLADAKAVERKAARQPAVRRHRSVGLTGVNAEIAALLRAQEAERA